MNKHLLLPAIVFFCFISMANAQDSIRYQPRLILDFPVLDFPHMNYAAGMTYNKRLGNLSGGSIHPRFTDFIRSYESPSMQQAMAVTKNLHATNYYFNNRLWNKWIKPTTKKKQLLNRVAANVTAGAVDYALAYYLMVFGPVWLHEEFHRNGTTHQCISSFDETYYRFGEGIPSGSVSKVKDADLVRFKKEAPQEMIRSFAAGIESQYQLVRYLEKDNFFSKTNYPNIAMNILITQQAVGYVNQFKKKDYDASIDTMNKYGVTVAERDFVGWDFTGWVHTLFRPDEAYEARGTHPNGVGINRVIKRSQLTKEEDDYLVKMGKMQYLNFLSPSMVGIQRIRLNENTSFNFGIRHILNSFGYDVSADFFIDRKGKQWLVALHGYRNKEKFFPGIEVENPSLQVKAGKKIIPLQARAMLWLQPKDQLFTADRAEAGLLLQLRGRYVLNNTFSLYAELEGKTDGWVAANPYLRKNLTLRMGMMFDIHR